MNLLAEKNVNVYSKKGAYSSVNQDNFFTVVDGDTKIFGIFDGHGSNGHHVSQFAMGQMLDYIQNSDEFRKLNFQDPNSNFSDEEMKKAIRSAFSYV